MTKTLIEEKITINSFVAAVGGLLGLFSGFSFIGCVEIVYITFGYKRKQSK